MALTPETGTGTGRAASAQSNMAHARSALIAALFLVCAATAISGVSAFVAPTSHVGVGVGVVLSNQQQQQQQQQPRTTGTGPDSDTRLQLSTFGGGNRNNNDGEGYSTSNVNDAYVRSTQSSTYRPSSTEEPTVSSFPRLATATAGPEAMAVMAAMGTAPITTILATPTMLMVGLSRENGTAAVVIAAVLAVGWPICSILATKATRTITTRDKTSNSAITSLPQPTGIPIPMAMSMEALEELEIAAHPTFPIASATAAGDILGALEAVHLYRSQDCSDSSRNSSDNNFRERDGTRTTTPILIGSSKV